MWSVGWGPREETGWALEWCNPIIHIDPTNPEVYEPKEVKGGDHKVHHEEGI